MKGWRGQGSFHHDKHRTEKVVPKQRGTNSALDANKVSFDNHLVLSSNLLCFHVVQIGKVTETSLSANQERKEMEKKRLVWNVEGSSREESKVMRGGPVHPSKLVVELAPMEIRTFIIDFTHAFTRKIFDT